MTLAQMTTWESIFETIPSGLLVVESTGGIVQINSRALELLGLPQTNLHLQNLPNYLHPIQKLLQEATEEQVRAEIQITFPNQTEASTLGYTLKLLKQGASSLKLFVFSDITQVLKDRLAFDLVKEELSQSKKLAAIGTMISGVAHELNNPLTGISMGCQLAQLTLDRLQKQVQQNKLSPEALSEALTHLNQEIGKITGASKKAGILVSDLLNYSRPVQPNLKAVAIKRLLSELLQSLKSHPEFSQITWHLEEIETDLFVLADRVKLEQVFYNLFKNASDATARRGHLQIHYRYDTEQVTIDVQDNGPGIDKSVLDRIFDPFYSTKGNAGVGLGLSISFRTMEQHHGSLSASSSPGQGSTFHVTLPRFYPDAQVSGEASS